MATDPVDDILKRFEGLSPIEREKLIHLLDRRQTESDDKTSSRTLFDALNDRGLIGCIDDVPEDWSTNPKYMEGFGQDAQ